MQFILSLSCKKQIYFFPIKNEQQTILGIDPGTNLMGYGIIVSEKSQIKLISAGIVNLSKYENHFQKLHKIHESINSLIRQYAPDTFAIESPFFGKNVQSMLKLGRAQGVAISTALQNNLPVFEYAPKRIKQSITGNGNASKEQVAAMLQQILNFKNLPKYLDATDALATAVCHNFQKTGNAISGIKYNGWGAFIAANPKKIKR